MDKEYSSQKLELHRDRHVVFVRFRQGLFVHVAAAAKYDGPFFSSLLVAEWKEVKSCLWFWYFAIRYFHIACVRQSACHSQLAVPAANEAAGSNGHKMSTNLAGIFGLFHSAVRQIRIKPATKSVLFVPGTLSVPHHHNFVRCHLRNITSTAIQNFSALTDLENWEKEKRIWRQFLGDLRRLRCWALKDRPKRCHQNQSTNKAVSCVHQFPVKYVYTSFIVKINFKFGSLGSLWICVVQK